MFKVVSKAVRAVEEQIQLPVVAVEACVDNSCTFSAPAASGELRYWRQDLSLLHAHSRASATTTGVASADFILHDFHR
jgi:hypothetical protein